MAAFENVSKVMIKFEDRDSVVDIQKTLLPREVDNSDDYNPKEHREPKAPIKTWMAYFNLLRTIVGTGLLGYPLAISQSGLVLGPVIAIGTGALVTYSHLLLLNSLNEIARRLKIPRMPYRYGFRLALLHGPFRCKYIGAHGPTIIATLMILSQIGSCTVIIIFTSDSLKDILDWSNVRSALLLWLIPYLLMEYSMKNLNIVSYTSGIGNIVNLVALIIVIYFSLIDKYNEHNYAVLEATPILFTFGTCLFNSSAVGVVLSLDRSLKNPNELVKPCGVVPVGIMIPSIFGALFGVLGYLSFGTMEENVLRYLPFDDKIALTAIALYMISVVFVYPIQCYPGMCVVMDTIESHYPKQPPPQETLRKIETIARPTYVLVTFCIAYAIPFQGPFVAFVGNLCTTLLVLVFPALMDFSLHYPHVWGRNKWKSIKDVVIMVLGLVSWVFGVYFCGKLISERIVALLQPEDNYF